jgi:erythromycin esterase
LEAGSTSSDHPTRVGRGDVLATHPEWLKKEAYPGQKIVVWAHNGHVGLTKRNGMEPMGNRLRASLGEYMSLGFAIHTGSVRASTRDGEQNIGLTASDIPPREPGTGGATLHAAGLPLFFFDLRKTVGDLAQWLATPKLHRTCGAVWQRSNAQGMAASEARSKAYDALIYIDRSEAARGL